MPSPAESLAAGTPLAELVPAYVAFLREQHTHGAACSCGGRSGLRALPGTVEIVRAQVAAATAAAPTVASLPCSCGREVCCACGTSLGADDAAAHAAACPLRATYAIALCVEAVRQVTKQIGLGKRVPKRATATSSSSSSKATGKGHGKGAAYASSSSSSWASAAPPAPPKPVKVVPKPPSDWTCGACTYFNKASNGSCEVCGTDYSPATATLDTELAAVLKASLGSSSTAAAAATTAAAPAKPASAGVPTAEWACEACTFVNPAGKTPCELCGTQPPASALPAVVVVTTTSTSSSSLSAPAPDAATPAAAAPAAAAPAAATTTAAAAAPVTAAAAAATPATPTAATMDADMLLALTLAAEAGDADAADALAAAGAPVPAPVHSSMPVDDDADDDDMGYHEAATGGYSAGLSNAFSGMVGALNAFVSSTGSVSASGGGGGGGYAAGGSYEDAGSEEDTDPDTPAAKAKAAAKKANAYSSSSAYSAYGGGSSGYDDDGDDGGYGPGMAGGTGYAGNAGETAAVAHAAARKQEREAAADNLTAVLLKSLNAALLALDASVAATSATTSGVDLALQLLVGPGYGDGLYLRCFAAEGVPAGAKPAPAAATPAAAAAATTAAASPAAVPAKAAAAAAAQARAAAAAAAKAAASGDAAKSADATKAGDAAVTTTAAADAGPAAAAPAAPAAPVVVVPAPTGPTATPSRKYCFSITGVADGVHGGSVLNASISSKLRMTMMDLQSGTAEQREFWFALVHVLQRLARFPGNALVPVLLYSARRDANARAQSTGTKAAPAGGAATSTTAAAPAAVAYVPWGAATAAATVKAAAKTVAVSGASTAGLLSPLRSKAALYAKAAAGVGAAGALAGAGSADTLFLQLLGLAQDVQDAAEAADKSVIEWAWHNKRPADAPAAAAAAGDATSGAGTASAPSFAGWKVSVEAETALGRTLSDDGADAKAAPAPATTAAASSSTSKKPAKVAGAGIDDGDDYDEDADDAEGDDDDDGGDDDGEGPRVRAYTSKIPASIIAIAFQKAAEAWGVKNVPSAALASPAAAAKLAVPITPVDPALNGFKHVADRVTAAAAVAAGAAAATPAASPATAGAGTTAANAAAIAAVAAEAGISFHPLAVAALRALRDGAGAAGYKPTADLVARYEAALKEEAYTTMEGLRTTHVLASYPGAGSKSSGMLGSSAADAKRLMRVSAEMANLPDLAVYWASSIVARSDESSMDYLRACIVGPADTPYCNGFFGFDIVLPPTYPMESPKVQFTTTGGGSVRFNPNLYAEGKVCLSLLGTWSGPGWEPGVSTLSQVLIAIQAQILVEQPYANEPGFETRMKTPFGRRQIAMHNTQLRLATIRHAMLEALRKPPAGFERAVKCHFYFKRDELKHQLGMWLAEAQAYAEYEVALQAKWRAAHAVWKAAEEAEKVARAELLGWNRDTALSSHAVFGHLERSHGSGAPVDGSTTLGIAAAPAVADPLTELIAGGSDADGEGAKKAQISRVKQLLSSAYQAYKTYTSPFKPWYTAYSYGSSKKPDAASCKPKAASSVWTTVRSRTVFKGLVAPLTATKARTALMEILQAAGAASPIVDQCMVRTETIEAADAAAVHAALAGMGFAGAAAAGGTGANPFPITIDANKLVNEKGIAATLTAIETALAPLIGRPFTAVIPMVMSASLDQAFFRIVNCVDNKTSTTSTFVDPLTGIDVSSSLSAAQREAVKSFNPVAVSFMMSSRGAIPPYLVSPAIAVAYEKMQEAYSSGGGYYGAGAASGRRGGAAAASEDEPSDPWEDAKRSVEASMRRHNAYVTFPDLARAMALAVDDLVALLDGMADPTGGAAAADDDCEF